MLRVGSWCVNPAAGLITRDGESARVEARTMRLLVCLAERAGEVVSIDELLDQVWPDVTVAPDSVYQAVTSLRRLLGDDPKQPVYIATVPRLGYRMVASVEPWVDPSVVQTGARANTIDAPHVAKTSSRRLKASYIWPIGAALCLALVVAFLFWGATAKNSHSGPSAAGAIAPLPQNSIAVLPFLDLTDAMNQEPFADGMTEELIDKLSKIPGLKVPPPTSSFYFKGKLWPRSNGKPQITIGEIAKTLGVAYVLDGSVRKSGARVRVDARMIRADNGYVVWSETYNRPFDDILMVQDDIAGEVAKALRASIEGRPDH
jgi:transcriptional activator of cad operon